MRILTETEVREALYKAVKLKGEDYVYPEEMKLTEDGGYQVTGVMASCVYWDRRDPTKPPAPCCIVGVTLDILGIPPDWVEEFRGVADAIDKEKVSLEANALMLLEKAQEEQDDGAKWGAAIAHAEAYLAVEDDEGAEYE